MAIKICLDAGHYGRYNRSPVVPAYYESEMTWTLHQLMKKELEAYGFQVVTTRADQEKDLGVYERGLLAKGCDLFLSLHSNACDTEAVDYPVAVVQLNGSADKLGQALADACTKTMGCNQAGRIWTRKGADGRDWYGVLRGSAAVGVPGILMEHSFHTNTRATKWLLKDSNLAALAAAEAKVIADHYGLKKNNAPKGELYRVQVGAYKVKANAAKQLDKVKKAGFKDAFLLQTGDVHRVQVGAFTVKANAQNTMQKLKKAGIAAFVTVNQPERKTVDELAHEVIHGEWGSGADRETALRLAGYDYQAVQARVNQILKK